MNLKSAIPPKAKRAEVPPIEGEDVSGPRILGEDHERRVGIVEVCIGVLSQDRLRAFQSLPRSGDENGAALEHEAEHGASPAFDATKQVSRLRDDRFGRDDGPRPLLEERHARSVMRLAPVEQAHERARVEEKLTGHGEAIPGRSVENSRQARVGVSRELR